MNLVLIRRQAKGMMGGVSFEIVGKITLSQEEANLVKHYKLANEELVRKPFIVFGVETGRVLSVSVKNLLNGDSFKAKDLSEVVAHTDSLLTACEALKTYLEVARKFGGEEILEF